MSKKKDIQQLLTQRERISKKHEGLKAQINIALTGGRRPSEVWLKRTKRHKLLCKDIIVAIDQRLADLRRPELAYAGGSMPGALTARIHDSRISA